MDLDKAKKSGTLPKISIITVCYNSAETIRETIESVLSQDYLNVEYIIFDGASSDETLEIVKGYGSKISFTSEKDEGLYDAMNKAIDRATGEFVGILNSDDLYASKTILSEVVRAFETRQVDSVFGDLYYFSNGAQDKPIRYYKGDKFKREKIRQGLTPPHPTFFVRKTIYEKYGKFDTQFRLAADFDLMSRFLYVHSISFAYLPTTMVKMRMGGISTGSFRRIIEINKEDLASLRKNKIPTNFLLFHLKYFYKVFGVKNFAALLRKGN